MKNELPKLKETYDELIKTYSELQTKAKAKHKHLADKKEFYQLLQDIDEEESSKLCLPSFIDFL